MATGETQVKVALPEELVDRIEERVAHTEFDTSDDYISYVLKEVLYQVEEANKLAESESVDEQKVEERLKSLGYLND